MRPPGRCELGSQRGRPASRPAAMATVPRLQGPGCGPPPPPAWRTVRARRVSTGVGADHALSRGCSTLVGFRFLLLRELSPGPPACKAGTLPRNHVLSCNFRSPSWVSADRGCNCVVQWTGLLRVAMLSRHGTECQAPLLVIGAYLNVCFSSKQSEMLGAKVTP